MTDWEEPATWDAGDDINAETWVARVNDPLGLLLRRPLLVVRRTTDVTISSGANTAISFDTVDQDDDGMVLAGTPVSRVYVQRDGVYSFWWSVTWINNGVPNAACRATVAVPGYGDKLWRSAPVEGSGVGQDEFRSLSGELALHTGDPVEFRAVQYTGSSMTIKAEFNAPRACLMWKRPL